MKKHLTTLFLFAATMITAFTLASCGEEVVIDDSAGSKEGLTVFAGTNTADGTRTTMDANGVFKWQKKDGVNDQIWIDPTGTSGTTFSLRSTSSEFYENNRSGKFYFGEPLGENEYNLSYTGLGSSTGDKVSISAEQQQSDWNISDHIGTSGDCATATATKVQGANNYTFTLDHKSSYLIFQPYAPAATDNNIYRLTEILITDTDGNPLAGVFPLSMSGLSTSGAENTSSQIRLTCSMGFELPAAASADHTVYAVMLPRDYRNLRVAYSVSSTSDGNFQVYENISGTYAANYARLIRHELSVPVIGPGRPDPDFIVTPTDANRRFGGVKFKPAFLFRTNGNATVNASLQLKEMKDDPFILLQYNQAAHGVVITEFQKRMYFNWNELAEIFGHADEGQGANWANTTATAAHITKSKTIGGKNYRLPTSGEYARLIETPNSGRATVNYYPASFAAVKVDLSADATYASKGWDHTRLYNDNANANYIMGYLFFPDNMVVLASKIKVASLNGRWGVTYSELTAEELKAYTDHGCMFLPATGGSYGSGWYNRGLGGYYWSGTIYANGPSLAHRFGFSGSQLSGTEEGRTTGFAAVPVEN